MFKKILINTIIILVVLGFGIFIGTRLPKKTITQGEIKEDSYQAGWDAARERLKESPLGRINPEGMEMKSVSGTIQKIESNKLTVKINAVDPLADPSLDTRVIIIDSNTKISLNVQKDQERLQKEMQEFQDKMRIVTEDSAQIEAPMMPPIPFEKKDIKISDLKENQQVTITANEDIKEKKEFAAIAIDAHEMITVTSAQNIPTPMPPVNVPAVVSAPVAPDAAVQSVPTPVMPTAMPVAPNVVE